MVADIEEVEHMEASEIFAKRVNAKEVLTRMSGEKFIFLIADGTVKLSGGDQVQRTSTLSGIAETEEKSKAIFKENQTDLLHPHRDSSWYDGEATIDVRPISGSFIYRHHLEPRVKLYVPREESIPLKFFDVTRITHTSQDVLLLKIDGA